MAPSLRPTFAVVAALSSCVVSADAFAQQRTVLNRGGAYAPDGERIAFFSNRDGPTTLFVALGDSAEPIAVSGGQNRWPAWSPDGGRLVYMSLVEGDWELFATDVSGHASRLTERSGNDIFPSWSPEGGRIAFACEAGEFLQICVLDLTAREIATVTSIPAFNNAPTWSPDGSRIVFHSSRGDSTDVLSVDVDSHEITTVGPTDHSNFGPSFSPDGSLLAYLKRRSQGVFEVCLFVLQSSAEQCTGARALYDSGPKWSPKGDLILIHRVEDDGQEAIVAIDLEGREVARVP